jgi:hypothetical protein
MVSRQQHVLILLGLLAWPAPSQDTGRKFYSDDPLWREPPPRAVSQVAVRKVDDIYDFLENSYVTPSREGKLAKRGARRALDINTLGEVPDNARYTNRHWLRRMSIPELERGPGNTSPPSSNDSWHVVGAKSDGVTAGFIIEDKYQHRYLLKLDPPQYPELCSAADVIGSKFFYALGYSTPENYIVRFRRENLVITEGVMWRDAGGRKHPLTERALTAMLKAQPAGPDGFYRGLASRWVPGKVVGPFSYRGTRSDDANDTVPHQDRRMLRGLFVFASWLNHQDTRSINSMDTLVTENGRQYLKHYLIDFGSILGSDGIGAKEAWAGHEYTTGDKGALVQLATFGLYAPRWMRSDYPNLKGAGRFDSWAFDPVEWKPNYPNPAFLLMDREDAFWAARQVAAFTDEEIRAIVKLGEFSDPRAAEWIADCLIKRRDKIAQAWFSRVLPLDKFRVTEGRLEFDDLGPKRAYEIQWSDFDNDRRVLTGLNNTTGPKIPSGGATDYLAARIGCSSASAGCPPPVTVYLRRSGAYYEIVGVDR